MLTVSARLPLLDLPGTSLDHRGGLVESKLLCCRRSPGLAAQQKGRAITAAGLQISTAEPGCVLSA